jgi:isoleucyl-tRNA synthetase
METKKTLLMPFTGFEMRGNLSQKEPLLVEKWKKEDVYAEMNKRHAGANSYILHDGPPYANGDIHCGHMLNVILKDFINRYKSMQGYVTPFVLGWDTHGLPIENNVTKSGVNRKTTPIVEFREKCEEYALSQVAKQKEEIRRLGVLGDYDNPYLTLNHDYEASQIEVFKTMALKGLIYKGLKPVYWSYSSESALAEAEIEYKDVESYAIYVAFDVKDGKGVIPNDAKVVIWTTTPWTLPANLAICLNERFTYGLFETNFGKLVFLSSLKEKISSEIGLTKCDLIKEFKGKELEFGVCKHPFYDRDSIIILGNHVTDDAGTGCVHTAPGHGEDDYVVGVKYNLPPYCPVDYKGYMMKEAGSDFEGLFYVEANEKALELLRANGHLLHESKFMHSYPHDWRTGKPVIFRATPQWFCSIKPIKEDLLKAINEIKWKPSWGKTRMENMVKERTDWCISRQRAWGVPLPIIYCEDDTPIMEEKVFDHIIELFKQYGSNIWYLKEAKELLPEGYSNVHSPNGVYTKETDIMDVWFDSGSSFNNVLVNRGLGFPSDLYLEGSDQYRGWFNASLILSVATKGVAPMKNIVSHGFIMDEHWEKMSKSKGNGIDPIKVANVFGADILRYWVASVDYQADCRISEDIIKQCAEGYRKIRNTFKFLLGNLANGPESKFDPIKDKVETFEEDDLFILARLEETKNKVIDYFDDYNFQLANQEILNFMSVDLSSFYLDITKDILYCNSKNALRRKQVQNVIYECTDTLMRLLNPIIPFTMDEVNRYLDLAGVSNVQYLSYPSKSNKYDSILLAQYKAFLSIREDILKAIELLRRDGVIGSSQEAEIIISFKEKTLNILSNIPSDELARLFIVSKVTIVSAVEIAKMNKEDYFVGNNVYVRVIKATGIKCDRCWNYTNDTIEEDGAHICARCHEVLHEEHQD